MSEAERKVMIIGGGISGLACALAIKRIAKSTGLNIKKSKGELYQESAPHYILWRWAVELLIEAGLGSKLARISWPITNFKNLDADTKETLVQYPPPADAATSNEDLSNALLPPMLATRKIDLIRLLMLALIDHPNLDLVDQFVFTGANNSDLVAEPVVGLDADLAKGNWFVTEDWSRILPDLHLGWELESYIISSGTGTITARFHNGMSHVGDMLIGADGYSSNVRDFMLSSRAKSTHANSAIFSGITRLHLPPVDTPTELEDGRLIQDMTRDDLYKFCPEGSAVSLVGRGLAFGTTNIGNGMLGWNLVISQTEPNQHVQKVIMRKKQNRLSQAITKNPRSSVMFTDFKLPPDGEPFETAFAAQQRISQSRSPSPLNLLDEAEESLTGTEIRDLALRLCQPLPLPHPSHAIIARTDPSLTQVQDVMDVADEQPESYTSLEFHPGRIVLVGDAAHTIASNAHGSVGAGLAIADAFLVAKLIGKHLEKDSCRKDEESFRNIGVGYNASRIDVGHAFVREARAEGSWDRTENKWVRSLFRLGNKYVSGRTSYQIMLTRGGIEEKDLPSLSVINS